MCRWDVLAEIENNRTLKERKKESFNVSRGKTGKTTGKLSTLHPSETGGASVSELSSAAEFLWKLGSEVRVVAAEALDVTLIS